MPEARSGHTWTVDPSGSAAYLVGGHDQRESFADIWRYDLGADRWDPLQPAGPRPRPRSGHAAVWSDDVGVVVFGGETEDGTVLDDLWAYLPTTDRWRQLASDGIRPPGRSATCAALGPDGRIWISHGTAADGGFLDDVWAYDIEGDSWALAAPAAAGPSPRGGHGCWWTIDGALALYGGRAETTTFGDVWLLDRPGTDAAVWASREPGRAPGERSDFAWSRFNDRIVIVGGRDGDGKPLADTIAFDLTSFELELFAQSRDSPEGRLATALADDPAGERLLLFGGEVDGRASDDSWALTLP